MFTLQPIEKKYTNSRTTPSIGGGSSNGYPKEWGLRSGDEKSV